MENKAEFICSYSGDTKLLLVDRDIKLPDMLAELSALFGGPTLVSFKYHLPGEDVLISVSSEGDLHNMMLQYNQLHRDSPTRARMRLDLFSSTPLTPPAELQASTSSPTSVTALLTPRKYDVFISFRGDDTRTNFVSHLHGALRQNDIRTFIDYELPRGDVITDSLFEAIKDSYASVVVLSEDYASSKYCLDELVKIHECKEQQGQIVLPVFYDVDPSHVRKLTGSFAESFKEHMENPKLDPHRVQDWRDRLVQTGHLGGYDSRSRSFRDEDALIQKIVEDIREKMKPVYPSYNFMIGELVGKNHEHVEDLLRDVRSILICGTAGIGKTTIAKYIFNKCSHQYEGYCFLQNVRERSGNDGQGLPKLREELLSKLFKTKNGTLYEHKLPMQRNFIVLDDVSSLEQLEHLVGELQSYSPGNKIIITSSYRSVLLDCGVEKIHEVKKLNFEESLELFSMNAFNRASPRTEDIGKAKRAVRRCDGVPLALKLLGSFLRRKSEFAWDRALGELERKPRRDINHVLKLSYDGLVYEEKSVLRDIARFYKGMPEEHVIDLLNQRNAAANLRSLHAKALINISDDFVGMHDLIQRMAWQEEQELRDFTCLFCFGLCLLLLKELWKRRNWVVSYSKFFM